MSAPIMSARPGSRAAADHRQKQIDETRGKGVTTKLHQDSTRWQHASQGGAPEVVHETVAECASRPESFVAESVSQ